LFDRIIFHAGSIQIAGMTGAARQLVGDSPPRVELEQRRDRRAIEIDQRAAGAGSQPRSSMKMPPSRRAGLLGGVAQVANGHRILEVVDRREVRRCGELRGERARSRSADRGSR
jgi:hypothetical protein